MSYSRIEYTGDGATTDYFFDKVRIEDTDVKGSVNGVEYPVTYVGSNIFRFTTIVPAVDDAVVIYRDSDITTPFSTYPNRSYVRSENLEGNNNQLRYLIQETVDTVELGNPGPTGPQGPKGDPTVHDTLADAIADPVAVGDLNSFVQTHEFTAGTGVGGSTYKIVNSDPGFLGTINHAKTDGSGYWLQLVIDGDLHAESAGAYPGAAAATNTTAIQACINFNSLNNRVVTRIGDGEYDYTNLYFHYDVTNNPGFNSDANEQGRTILRGTGRASYGSYLNSFVRGTQLKSTSSTGSACIHAENGQVCRIEHMTLVANNTTKIVFFDLCKQGSGVNDVLFVQAGSGGGLEFKDIFNAQFSNIFGNGAGRTTSLGDGFYVYNETVGAGFISMDTVNVNAFANSVILGHKTRGSAARIHGMTATNVQGGEGAVGIIVGGGMSSCKLDLHVEDNDLGLKVINNAQNCEIMVTASGGNLKDIEVGSSTADENYYRNITLMPEVISIVASATLLEVFSSANTEGLTIYKPKFTGDGTNVAIELENTVHHNLKIFDPLYTSVATEITNLDRVQTYVNEQLEVKRTGNTGGALTEAPFQFRQDSTTGAQAPISLDQSDNNQPFIELITGVTPGAGLNSITTKNSGTATGPGDGAWTYSRMVLVRTTDGTGTTDYWMPLFTAV